MQNVQSFYSSILSSEPLSVAVGTALGLLTLTAAQKAHSSFVRTISVFGGMTLLCIGSRDSANPDLVMIVSSIILSCGMLVCDPP